MSDTQRSLGDLQALLADNSVRAITPQQLRDFLVSAFGGYGQLFSFAKSLTANIAPQTLSGLSAGVSSGVTPNASAGTLTVPVDGVYEIAFSVFFTGTAGRKFTFSSGSGTMQCGGKIDAAGDQQSASFVGPTAASITAGTTISVTYAADADGASLTITNSSLFVKRIG